MRILWDFDGTIFDTYPSIVENIYKQLSAARRQIVTREDVYQLVKVNSIFAMDMLDFNDVQRRMVEEGQYDVEPEKNPPFDYVEEVLKHAELNVIMTHKDAKSVKEILRHYDMSHYFTEIVTKESGFPRKPNSASYLYLHNKYQIDVVIGDRQLDLIPAKELGILTCSYCNNYPEADFYLDDYSNFMNVILGSAFGKVSHAKENPVLDAEWIVENFGNDKPLLKRAIELADVLPGREVAYLLNVGRLNGNKISGFAPVDSALYALEHGFSGDVIKMILFNKVALRELEGAESDIKDLYRKMSSFLTSSSKEKIVKMDLVITN